MESFEIEYSLVAEQDLREIAFYILSESKNIEVAMSFVKRLRKRADILKTFPYSGDTPRFRILVSLDYRMLVEGDYLIFYKVNALEKKVNIMSVLNGKQDYVRILKNRIQ